MALLRLFPLVTASGNPSGRTNLLPGGAGVQVAGKAVYPMVLGSGRSRRFSATSST